MSHLARKCLLTHVTDGKTDRSIAGTGRRGRKRKHVLDDLQEKRKIVETERESTRSHCQELLLEEAKDMWKGRLRK